MTGTAWPAHAEIINFAVRTSRGGLREPEWADLAALLVLVGAGARTHAAIGEQHPGDQSRRDEFAVCMWALACDLLAATLSGAPR